MDAFGFPSGVTNKLSTSSGGPLHPGCERWRRQETVGSHRQLGPGLRCKETAEVEYAEFSDRGRLHLADECGQIEILAGPPRSLDQGCQEDVFRTRDGISRYSGKDEKRRHESLDLVASGLCFCVPIQIGRLQRSRIFSGMPAFEPGV